MTQTIELGLDTFGDVTVDTDRQPLTQAQALRHVVEEGVLADQVGLDVLRRRRTPPKGLLDIRARSRAARRLRRGLERISPRLRSHRAQHRRSGARLPALLDAERHLERTRGSDRRTRLVHRVVPAVRLRHVAATRSSSRRSCNLFAELLKGQPVTWAGTAARAALEIRSSTRRSRTARCGPGSVSAAARSRWCARRATACR